MLVFPWSATLSPQNLHYMKLFQCLFCISFLFDDFHKVGVKLAIVDCQSNMTKLVLKIEVVQCVGIKVSWPEIKNKAGVGVIHCTLSVDIHLCVENICYIHSSVENICAIHLKCWEYLLHTLRCVQNICKEDF